MYRQKESGRYVDKLYVDELDGVDGGDGEGRRLLVGVVQLVEVPAWFVEFESLAVGGRTRRRRGKYGPLGKVRRVKSSQSGDFWQRWEC